MFCSVSHFYKVSFITKERGREKSNLQPARNPNPNRADATTGGPLFLIMTLTISKGTNITCEMSYPGCINSLVPFLIV